MSIAKCFYDNLGYLHFFVYLVYDERVRKLLLGFTLFLVISLFFTFTPKALAASCDSISVSPTIATTTSQIIASFTVPAPIAPVGYEIRVKNQNGTLIETKSGTTNREETGGTWKGSATEMLGPFSSGGSFSVEVYTKDTTGNLSFACSKGFSITNAPTVTSPSTPTPIPSRNCSFLYDYSQAKTYAGQCPTGWCQDTVTCDTSGYSCSPVCVPPQKRRSTPCDILASTDPLNPSVNQPVTLRLKPFSSGEYSIYLVYPSFNSTPISKGFIDPTYTKVDLGSFPNPMHVYVLVYEYESSSGTTKNLCSDNFFFPVGGGSVTVGGGSVTVPTAVPTAIITPPPCKTWVALSGTPVPVNSGLIANGQARCAEFETAIGTIATDQTGLIRKIFTVILSLSGGIALLLIIYSGYQLAISRGNPEKIQGAKETITSAIVGLLFVIFSVAILQIIGVEILRIPGFSP